MFILHTSNRAENLLAHLAGVIDSQPLDSPFDPELFLIQSQGMERWLSQQLASHFGVWGNYQFYFPGNFFSDIGAQFADLPADGNYQREQMVWIFEQMLRKIGGDQHEPHDEDDGNAPFQIVSDYIGGENSAVRRFQLAQQLARIFDQYQIMRPEWLRAWSKGELLGLGRAEPWQALLWQKIEKGYGHCHRGELWERAIAAIERLTTAEELAKLPQRVSIFGLNTIPPLLLHLLRGLSQHIDIHLYLLAPTSEYWGEGGSRKSLLEQLATINDADAESEHRLLLSLGEQAREFRGLLLNQVDFSHEFASYEPNGEENPSMLARLQNGLLSNKANCEGVEDDGSITIHSCHSRLREVEVLHDQLLDLLNRDSGLELREIVVMSPDIQNYAPHINTIFQDIPHAIADRTLKQDSEILDAMIQFLQISRGRFGWQEVLDLLERPVIFPALGLVESELELIRHWVTEVNIRWGLSGEHRSEVGLPGFDAFSWQAGLERLMMGYIIGSEEVIGGSGDEIWPYSSIEGNSAQPLGALYRFIEILTQAHDELSKPTTLAGWGERLGRYAKQIFDPRSAEEGGAAQLDLLIEQLTSELGTIHHGEVDIEVIEQWLEGSLSERKSSNGFLRGELTFCSMLPMRAIPFRVIALIGMNEGDYPRIIQPYTFDLMAAEHRPGDRSARNDDRAQFLETLLSARERLIITYVGQSIQDNSEIAPSAVVGELVDLLENSYEQSEIVTRHPLQPFNRRYFDATSKLFSYSAHHVETASLLADAKRESVAAMPSITWWHGTLNKEVEFTIEINDLFKFFKNPQRHFLNEALGVRLQEVGQEPAERERFELDSLENYITNQQIVEQLLSDQRAADTAQIGAGDWWIGAAGEMELERRVAAIEPFVEDIRDLNIGKRLAKLDIDIAVGRYRIVGQLGDMYEHGALLYRYSWFKGHDFIKGWLYHLIANRVEPTTTVVMTEDRQIQIAAGMGSPDALERWLNIYQAGQLAPSSLFVEPALAYLTQAANARARKSPLEAAKTALVKQFNDGHSPELELLYRGTADVAELIAEPFDELCQELLLPLWQEQGSELG